MLATLPSPADTLSAQIGRTFGPSRPALVGQDRIDRFADATDDHQWIHTDPVAAAQSPFGGTIAHGFLTLSLLASAVSEVGVIPAEAKAVLNYGLDRVRFLAPVPSGSTVRTQFTLESVEDKGDGRALIRLRSELFADGADKPAVVADQLAMVIG